MLYQNIVLQNKLCKLSPILLMLSCLFGHSKKSLILGSICKVVNSIYKKYAIFISQISLSPFRPISELDWQQVIFVFLLQLSVNTALRRKQFSLLQPQETYCSIYYALSFSFKKFINFFLNSFQAYLNLNFPELYHPFLYGFNGWGSSAPSLQSHYKALKG